MISRKNFKPGTAIPQRERSDRLREHPRRRGTQPTAPGGLPPPSAMSAEQKIAGASAVESVDQVMHLGMCKIDDVTHVTVEGELSAILPRFGTNDLDFFVGLLHQVSNAGAKGRDPDEKGIKFQLAFIKGVEPRDQIEAALIAQMAATHAAVMRFANRLAHAESPEEQDSAERAFTKLTRTFAAQVEALPRYRSSGKQQIFVQQVSVNDGGQAIVGNLTRPAHEGALKKQERVTPVRADARRTATKILGEPQREPVALRPRLQR
jgi:hypothetical protein